MKKNETIESRMEKMMNPGFKVNQDLKALWNDLEDFEPLKEYISNLDDKTQLKEVFWSRNALEALAKNTGSSDVAQYYVNLIGKARLNDKSHLLKNAKYLPPFSDASNLLELVDHHVHWYSAIEALGATSDPRAEAVAREKLFDEKKAYAAAEALRQIATMDSVPALVEVIGSTKNNVVKRTCLAALRNVDGENHLDLFAEIYGEARSKETRWQCLIALRDYGKGEGVDAVASRLIKIAKKKNRPEPYTGGSIIAPKDAVAILHRHDEHYATEFTLGVEYLQRVGGSEAEAFFTALEKHREKLLDSEREFLAAQGLE